MLEWMMLFVVGLLSGIIGSLVGLGGGIIIVPALLFISAYTSWIAEVTPQIAVGTSSLVIIFTGLSSTLYYMKHKTVDYKSGFLFFISSGPGAIVGALTNKYLNADTFNIYFGLFIIFISFILMIKGKLKPKEKVNGKETTGWLTIKRTNVDRKGKESTYSYNLILAFLIAFVVGFLSGIFGIGGGALMVPAMLLLFRFPPHVAVATSMFMIILSSSVSSITHFSLGNISWSIGIALIPGAWIGAKLGAIINQKMKGETVIAILRILLIIIGIRLILQN